MSEAVLFPQGHPRARVDEVHAKAFRNLEGSICDLDRMAEITEELVADWGQDVIRLCLSLFTPFLCAQVIHRAMATNPVLFVNKRRQIGSRAVGSAPIHSAGAERSAGGRPPAARAPCRAWEGAATIGAPGSLNRVTCGVRSNGKGRRVVPAPIAD
ncbi:hypothetical protein BKD09_19300 [Bradyrhizobium japonicum]|uniref:Uncharacterized protein n=1 Tax=Bradyrhizobium japonicum TaxID=375 RepID=A0A1L3FAZ2_BRAJP|nr:hypothetical protein BKD09_19300 [Bradyrhizobium japonicum]